MSTSAAIIYKNRANRVNFDGYPEAMLPILESRTEEQIKALVNAREIRGLGKTPEEDEFYKEFAVFFEPSPSKIGPRARSEFGASYVYTWTESGWIVS